MPLRRRDKAAGPCLCNMAQGGPPITCAIKVHGTAAAPFTAGAKLSRQPVGLNPLDTQTVNWFEGPWDVRPPHALRLSVKRAYDLQHAAISSLIILPG